MIFTEKKITINNNQCKIDSPVVLYRGDYNVEVRFTIVSSPYKYSNKQETNVIESTEASYGQLVIQTPNTTPIFSEITATKKGAITFTITAEMIDEVTEIGNYTFQIRLLDENKESRATIPEVVNGIEIREPIAAEDVSTTNEVGVATVGYALTTAGTTEDAFDSQGNYIKTNWATGNRITAEKLNKIEAGIDGVNQKVASGGTGGQGLTVEQSQQLSTAYQHSQTTHVQASDIPTKTSQLTNDSSFVNETYVTNAINNAQLGGGGSGSNNASDISIVDTANNFTSTNVEGALQEVGSQIKEIVNYSLVKHTDGLLYIKKQDGTLIGTGVEVGSGDIDLSTLTISISGQILTFKNGETILSTATIPTAVITDEQLTRIIESKIADGSLSNLTIEDNSITTSKLSDDVINNLVTITTKTIDNFINVEDFISKNTGLYPANGNNFASTGTMVTDFISVESDTLYAYNGLSKLALYDGTKKFISYASSTPFTTTSETKFIKCEALMTTTSSQLYFGQNIKASNLSKFDSTVTTPEKTKTITTINSNIPVNTKKDIINDIFEINEENLNIIEDSKIKVGYRLNPQDGYKISTGNGFNYNELIPLTPVSFGETYTLCMPQKVYQGFAFYDENYTFLKYVAVTTEQDVPYTFTLNSDFLGEELINVAYIRFSTDGSYGGKYGGIMLVKGSTISKAFIPYNDYRMAKIKTSEGLNLLLNQMITSEVGILKSYKKRWIAHGDSLTYYSDSYARYTDYANSYLHCELTNKGNAGATMALRNSSSVENVTTDPDNISMAYLSSVTDYSKYDICTIFFGTNDMSSNVPIGTIDSTDETTFLGALNSSITRIYRSNYKIKILLITPIYRSEETNLGLDAYRNALIEFGNKYSIPVCEMHKKCSVNKFNVDGTLLDGVHLTGTGAEHVGSVLAGEIINLF